MKNLSIRKQGGLAAACALALGLVSATAVAQTERLPTAEDSAMLADSQAQVVMSPFGMCWHSGQGPRPESTAACDPNYRAPAPVAQYVAPVAAPAPIAAPVAAAAVAQPIQKMTFDADALFDFDKAALRPAGRSSLDSFVGKLKTINPSMITVTGHTDRLGSDSYNQALSERRAAAVKAYLVSQGIESKNVQAEGKGETHPVTKTGDCTGGKSAKLIACLQPDRRVEVEASGASIKQ